MGFELDHTVDKEVVILEGEHPGVNGSMKSAVM